MQYDAMHAMHPRSNLRGCLHKGRKMQRMLILWTADVGVPLAEDRSERQAADTLHEIKLRPLR